MKTRTTTTVSLTDKRQTPWQNLRQLLLCLLILLPGILTAQTIENPTFKARNGSIRNITRIERTPECTKVYIHAIFRPHWWIKEDGENYLEDTATGIRYKQTGAEGIELKKETYLPDSGEMDFVLLFEPLPQETRKIHFIDPNGREGNTFDISLVADASEPRSLLEPVEGNWFSEDAQSRWTYGIYDSIVILNNRLYTPVECRKKGKRILMTASDRKDGSTVTLKLTARKDGSCLIALNDGEEQRYVRTRKEPAIPDADNGYGTDFFRRDSVYLQGYLKGYDPRLGFDSGILYLSNEITRKDYPTVVPINPDGSFECKFILSYPVCQNLTLNNQWIPFYAEPGDTVTMYLDWEDIMARSRARDNKYPLIHTAYMGKTAALSYLAVTLNDLIDYPYEKLNKAQKTLTPAQFQKQLEPYTARWQQQADSLCRLYATSQKAVSLIRNHTAIKAGEIYFDYQMPRSYYARQDTANQVLQVQPDASYYDFLKQMPLDEMSALACSRISVFINRFEYMDPLEAANNAYKSLAGEEDFKKLPDNEKLIRIYAKKYEIQDSIIQALCNEHSPLLWQIARVRDLRAIVAQQTSRKDAECLIGKTQAIITHPYMQTAVKDMIDELHPAGRTASYQLPAGKATDIFRRIIAPHAGKVLFIDFWGIYCGPCRGGIQATADLRRQYRNHPDFQFVYITSEKESPGKAYTDYVEKNLKGEACYRLTDTEYKYMRQLFQFNGIPHYVIVEKDGSISTEDVGTHNLKEFLQKRFGSVPETQSTDGHSTQ